MATSGTNTFNLDVDQVIEEAFERCGINSRSGYDLKKSINNDQQVFDATTNIKSWKKALKKHSKQHTKKHMSSMKKAMKKGKSFKKAHNKAMGKVGR